MKYLVFLFFRDSNADDKPKEEEAAMEVTNDVPKVEEPKTPRPLHQTVSLFVRNVPPKISHNDITSVRSQLFPGREVHPSLWLCGWPIVILGYEIRPNNTPKQLLSRIG